MRLMVNNTIVCVHPISTISVFRTCMLSLAYKVILFWYLNDDANKCILRERGGVVVEGQTPNREVLGLIPTSVTVLCP